MKYDVHINTLVSVKIAGVEADSQLDAIGKAEDMVNFSSLFDHLCPPPGVAHVEWTDEHDSFLVDEEGDATYERSQVYPARGVRPVTGCIHKNMKNTPCDRPLAPMPPFSLCLCQVHLKAYAATLPD